MLVAVLLEYRSPRSRAYSASTFVEVRSSKVGASGAKRYVQPELSVGCVTCELDLSVEYRRVCVIAVHYRYDVSLNFDGFSVTAWDGGA